MSRSSSIRRLDIADANSTGMHADEPENAAGLRVYALLQHHKRHHKAGRTVTVRLSGDFEKAWNTLLEDNAVTPSALFKECLSIRYLEHVQQKAGRPLHAEIVDERGAVEDREASEFLGLCSPVTLLKNQKASSTT